jgi:hypothetical protein
MPIEGADRIELALVDGWQCVVKKGEFMEGDFCVYFEVDSILPASAPWAEFMKERKYRVKTAKFRKALSQGLALPLHTFHNYGLTDWEPLGKDVTELLGVTKHDPEGDKERRQAISSKSQKPWWAKTYLGGKLWDLLHPRRGGWPEWLRKTDETRIQNIVGLDRMMVGSQWYCTEKLDGQSITVYYNREVKTGLFSKGAGGVCSRNIHYPKPVNNDWWAWALKNGILERLKVYCEEHKVSLALQGELVGPGIRDNKYRFPEQNVFVFNVWDINKQEYLPLHEKIAVIDALNLIHVPMLTELTRIINDVVETKVWKGASELREFILGMAEGYSKVAWFSKDAILSEGIVIRKLDDDGVSFKAISNIWLLKYES